MSDEQFLEEQLKRIREMTEQIARLQHSASELSVAFERDHIAATHDPLREVRDFRTHSSSTGSRRGRADEHAGRHHARSSARGRRK